MDAISADDLRNDGDPQMAEIFFSNLPHNCTGVELRDWVESHGIKTIATRIILDLVAGVAPAFGYVELVHGSRIKSAVEALNGKHLRHHKVIAKPVHAMVRAAHRSAMRS